MSSVDDIQQLVQYKSAKRPTVRASKRKIERKKARVEKRKRKTQAHLEKSSKKKRELTNSESTIESGKVKKSKKEKKKKKEKKVKKSVRFEEEPVFDDVEDMEMDYLERKLGFGKSKSGKNSKKSKKLLEKELSGDGFGDGIVGFLSELDKIGSKSYEDYNAPNGEFVDEMEYNEDFPSELDDSDMSNDEMMSDEDSDSDMEAKDDTERNNKVKQAKTPEDLELEYLEQKLGFGTQKSKKNTKKNHKKLAKELAGDGFGDGIANFLQELDAGFQSDEMDETFENIKQESDSSGEEDDEDDTKGEKVYISKKQGDLYGGDIKTKERPRFRIGGAMNEDRRLKLRINGLLNRLAESNISPILSDILRLYSDNSNRIMNELLCDLVLNSCSDESRVMETIVLVLAALVASLNTSVGPEVGAFIIEAAVKRLMKEQDQIKEDLKNKATDWDERSISKKTSNLSLFLSYLYVFGVAHESLILDIVSRLATTLHDVDIFVLQVIFKFIGYQLRSSNPEKFKDLFVLITTNAQNRDLNKKNDFTGFLLESINSLKNNKQEARNQHEKNVEKTKRLRSWLRTLNGSHVIPLQVSVQELLEADDRGRWWIVGGVWAGDRETRQLANADAIKSRIKAGGVAAVLAQADQKLLDIAVKKRMKTDIRKAVFCILMGGYDYLEAFDRILKLNLRDRQEREIVHVLGHCCRDCKTYNPYFALVANKLCEYKNAFKFTFQLHFWDSFKIMHELKPKKIANLARMLGDMVLNYSLSLAVIKSVDFTILSADMVLFMNVFFMRILAPEDLSGREADQMVLNVFERLQDSKGKEEIRDGILVLFRNHLHVDEHNDPKLLLRRIKLAVSVLENIGVDETDQLVVDEDDFE